MSSVSASPSVEAHAKYNRTQQLQILNNSCASSASVEPFIVGKITHDHTEPFDYLEFCKRGASILLMTSGVTLHSIAVRAALDTLAQRPILLWQYGADKSFNYIIEEEHEALVSGCDGILFSSTDLVESPPPTGNKREHGRQRSSSSRSGDAISGSNSDASETAIDPVALISHCRVLRLAIYVYLDSPEHLEAVVALKPDVLVTCGSKEKDLTQEISVLGSALPFYLHLNCLDEQEELNGNTTHSADYIIDTTDTKRFGSGTITCDATRLRIPHKKSPWDSVPLVKVCGIKTLEAAQVAVDSGADMVGMILVPNRSRTVDLYEAKKISDYVHACRRRPQKNAFGSIGLDQHESQFEVTSKITRARTQSRPLVVGVFQNQPLDVILTLQQELNLDMVQLHGSEPLEMCRLIPVPVIKRFTPGTVGFENCTVPGYHTLSLLDGEVGGEGRLVDWSAIKTQVALGARFILAGGLNASNVASALHTKGVYGVDVSGGVETNGQKDLGKIQQFVENARKAGLGSD